jgi:hypothetical protein
MRSGIDISFNQGIGDAELEKGFSQVRVEFYSLQQSVDSPFGLAGVEETIARRECVGGRGNIARNLGDRHIFVTAVPDLKSVAVRRTSIPGAGREKHNRGEN